MDMGDSFKEERQKLAKMTFAQKIDHIWTYYKFWFLVIAMAVIVGISFINAQLKYNPDAMNFIVCDAYADDLDTVYTTLNSDFKDYLEYAPEDDDLISIDDTISFSSDKSDQMASLVLQKFLAVVISGGADVMLSPASAIEYYGAQGIFADLEEVLDPELFKELKEKDMLFTATYIPTEEEAAEGEVEKTWTVGIRLPEDNYFSKQGMHMDDMALAVFVSGDRQTLGLQLVDMILGRPNSELEE